VAQAEERRFQIAEIEKHSQEAEETIRELQDKLKECQTSWEVAWLPCAVAPRTPAEMEDWREIWSQFKRILSQLRAAEEIFQQKIKQVKQAKKQLATVLSECEEKEFDLLFEKARKRVQQGEEAAGRRKAIAEQLQMLNTQLETFHQNSARVNKVYEEAADNWKSQCQAIGLPEGIPPNTGLALLQERAEVLAKFDNWKRLSTESQKRRRRSNNTNKL